MKVLLKLYSTEDSAADGSRIPRKQTEDYLASEDYKILIKDKLGFGGVTHKDRRLDPQYKGIVGQDDQVLINDNATHYFTKIFMKDATDPFVYGEVEFFDPELFIGRRKEIIQNLIGDIKSGVKIPVSIVIHAVWNSMNVAERIIRIKGVDFTMNNSFPNAGIVKTMSDSSVEVIKEFSLTEADKIAYGECSNSIKAFSAEVVEVEDKVEEDKVKIDPKIQEAKDTVELPKEVNKTPLTDKVFSRSDIAKKFGKNSSQYLATKNYAILTEDQLNKLTEEYDKINKVDLLTNISSDKNSNELIELLKDIVGTGNEEVIQNLFRSNRGTLQQILSMVPNDEPNRREIIRSKINEFLRNDPKTMEFSTINSVKDRMYLSKYPRISAVNRLIKSYKMYWDSFGKGLSELELKLFRQLVIQDINLLIKSVPNLIKEGKTLNIIYGLSQFNDNKILETSDELSKIYRKVILAENILKFIPKVIYDEWMISLTKFYEAILSNIEGKEVSINITLLDKLN